MPDPDLRALCQAVVDARAAWCAEADEHESAARGVTYLGAQDALREFLGRDRPNDEDILAVLNAERAAADARGYARAMGEVVERCKTEARDEWRTWPRGPEYKSALADVARWAAAEAWQAVRKLAERD